MNLLHVIPAPLHRVLYRVAHRLRRGYLRRSGRIIHGCSMIGRDRQGRILLVRHSYGPPVWAFPGGGMQRHETPVVAALREFREELGCELGDARRLTTFKENYLGAVNVSHVFTGLVEGVPRPDGREIVEARFFDRGELPAELSRTVYPRIAALDAAGARAPRMLQQQ